MRSPARLAGTSPCSVENGPATPCNRPRLRPLVTCGKAAGQVGYVRVHFTSRVPVGLRTTFAEVEGHIEIPGQILALERPERTAIVGWTLGHSMRAGQPEGGPGLP